MSQVQTVTPGKIVWIDLASPDPKASAAFYGPLFGWEHEVNPDPQYGGYGFFKLNGKIAAGVGPLQAEGQPPAWAIYVGTADADATAAKVEAAGGKVIAPPFDVAEQGRMAVFQDPAGAFISIWQSGAMGALEASGVPNSFSWGEINAHGFEQAKPFYTKVFGWSEKVSPMSEGGGGSYTEFQQSGESVAGGMEHPPQVPAEVPSYWLAYFGVNDVDGSAAKAGELGGTVIVPPMDFPGGRFALVQDPQGAVFGILKMG